MRRTLLGLVAALMPCVASAENPPESEVMDEERPSATVTEVEFEVAPEAVEAPKPPATGAYAGPELPSRFSVSFVAGVGTELTYKSVTPLIDMTTRVRIAPRGGFSFAASLGYEMIGNVYATGPDAESTHLLDIRGGPDLRVDRGPVRLFGGISGGLAAPLGGECVQWSSERCVKRKPNVSPVFGSKLGVGYQLFEVAAQAKVLPRTLPSVDANHGSATLFVVGILLGVGFDL